MWNDLLIFCLVVFLINGMLLMLLCMLNEKCKFGFCKQTGTRTTLYSEQLSSWASAEHVRLSNNAHTHGILPFGFGKQSWTQIAICGPFEGFGFCDDWQWLKQNYKVLILGVVYWPLGSVATQRPRLPPWQSYIVRYSLHPEAETDPLQTTSFLMKSVWWYHTDKHIYSYFNTSACLYYLKLEFM